MVSAAGRPCDITTVSEQLERVGKLQDAGGLAYLSTVAHDTPSAANVRAYAEIVAEKARLRELLVGGRNIEKRIAERKTALQIAQMLKPDIDRIASGIYTEAWPEPVNLFAELSAAPYQASEAPSELSDYPRLYAAQTGIDISIMLGAAVTCAAAAMPDQIQLCADSNSSWFAQSRLWMLSIAPPGAGKSPGERVMTEPLWALHSECDAQWRAAIKGMKEDETKPPRPRVVVGDATLEALSDVLVDNPQGVLVATDEFDAWLGAMDQYRSSSVGRDRGEWLRLFDGGPHSIERVKRGTVYVKNWGVSILTATTPVAMRRLARHLPEDGLIQRFLIVLARRQVLVTDVPRLDEFEVAKTRYAETIRRLHALKPGGHNGIVQLSFEAKRRFTEWRTENLLLQETFGSVAPALEGHIAKYPTLALRLAHVFHAARIVNLQSPEARQPESYPVPLETMELALAFLRRASQHAFSLYLGQTGASEPYELARAVGRLILSRKPDENAGGLQRREMIRRVVAFRDAADYIQSAALQVLEDVGWIRQREDGYRKAHPTRFAVNPLVHERFAKLAERERERRTTLRERIAESVSERREDRVPQ